MKYTRIFILVAAAIFFVAEVYNFIAVICGWNGWTIFSPDTAGLTMFVGILAGFFTMVPFLDMKEPDVAFDVLFYPFIGILLLWSLVYIFGDWNALWNENYIIRESVRLTLSWVMGLGIAYTVTRGLLSFAK